MAKHMLIDATHPEEIRVVVVDGKRLEEFDIELASKKQLKGNIYLAKVTRVEPSLQAAFVEYGGNRHGFLAFSEIHPDYYRIPVADREALLAEEAREAAAESAREEARDAAAEARTSRRRPGRGQAAKAGHDAEDDTDHSDDHYAEADEPEGGNRVPPELWPAQALGFGGDRLASGESYDDDEEDDAHQPDASAEAPGAPDPDQEDHRDLVQAEHPEEVSTDAEGQTSSPDAPQPSDAEPAGPSEGDNGAAGEATHGDASPSVPAESKPVPVEVIGGDEIEEVQPRRQHRGARSYKIQEVIKRRQVMLVQVTKEERGTKGAALTTYLSLAGRYCVLMPNTARGGGVSRKISSPVDRKRLKAILEELEIPDGMAVIIRTAGAERSKAELKRDYEYLLRLWDEIRELTLKSTAPSLVYEEANLIKRSIRDLYSRDIEDVIVDGEEGYKVAKSFMRTLTPSHAKRVQLYRDPTPLLHRYQVESQLDAIHNPVVQLKSGGYIVINSTEALVAIDVNSGRATRERNIEETAYKTNLEAAEEIARQLRLRDLAGLIVIDFIDMEESRHNAAVERRLKESMRSDRARIQIGRISAFGLLELSRQRMRPSLFETSTEVCQHCRGTGHVRSTESTVLHVLRSIEDECLKSRNAEGLSIAVPTEVALYILNHKRRILADIELRHGMRIFVTGDDHLIPPEYRVERLKALAPGEQVRPPVIQAIAAPPPDEDEDADADIEDSEESGAEARGHSRAEGDAAGDERRRKRPRRRRRGRDRGHEGDSESGDDASTEHSHSRSNGHADSRADARPVSPADEVPGDEGNDEQPAGSAPAEARRANGDDSEEPRRRRRRGRRGGRRRRRGSEGAEDSAADASAGNGEREAYDEGDDQGDDDTGTPELDEARADDAGIDAAAAETDADGPARPESGSRKRRSRSRRPSPAKAGASTDEAESDQPAASEPTLPHIVPEAANAPGVANDSDGEAGAAASAPAPAQPVALEPEPVAPRDAEEPPLAARPDDDRVREPVAAEAPPAESKPASPPRRGWWRRLAE